MEGENISPSMPLHCDIDRLSHPGERSKIGQRKRLMRTWCTEAGQWEAGHRFEVTCFGPVSKEAVLKMAELTGDFHPVRLMDRVAGDAGYGGLVLHPVWISGLADAVMRGAFPACLVKCLAIDYLSSAVDTDTLTFALRCGTRDRSRGEISLTFRVKNQNDVLVAEGSAHIVHASPQLVRNVPRETCEELVE
jgi:acyl dehydratase